MGARGKPLPVRWTAPEALESQRYSPQSDIWSFGVLCFEIWTKAAQPYKGSSNAKVWTNVLSGFRLGRPAACSQAVYDMMRDCWEYKPADRPRLESVSRFLFKEQTKSASELVGEDLYQSHSATRRFCVNPDGTGRFDTIAARRQLPSGYHAAANPSPAAGRRQTRRLVDQRPQMPLPTNARMLSPTSNYTYQYEVERPAKVSFADPAVVGGVGGQPVQLRRGSTVVARPGAGSNSDHRPTLQRPKLPLPEGMAAYDLGTVDSSPGLPDDTHIRTRRRGETAKEDGPSQSGSDSESVRSLGSTGSESSYGGDFSKSKHAAKPGGQKIYDIATMDRKTGKVVVGRPNAKSVRPGSQQEDPYALYKREQQQPIALRASPELTSGGEESSVHSDYF